MLGCHAGTEHTSKGINPAFETQGRRHQKPKQWYQWPNKKDWCPSKFSKNKNIKYFLKFFHEITLYNKETGPKITVIENTNKYKNTWTTSVETG